MPNILHLPLFLRHNVFSFLDLNTLINKIQFLNKSQRKSLITQGIADDILTQPRILKINLNNSEIISFDQISYCIKLSTELILVMDQIKENQTLILHQIIKKCTKFNKPMKLELIIGNETVRGWLNVLLMTKSANLNQVKHITLSVKKDYKDTIKTSQILSYFKGTEHLEVINLTSNI